MSDKMNGAVWDMECPAIYNGMEFKPGHKFVLLAYADHADHWGKNIYPAIETIAKKTGYDKRSVQRLTRELEEMGALVEDGQGPHGTNKWKMPLDRGGDKITPLDRGDKITPEGGDIPSGDIPSGDKMTPELIKKESILNSLTKIFQGMDWWKKFESELATASLIHEGNSLIVGQLGKKAAIMRDRYGKTINRTLAVTEYKQIIFTE